jgi:hypothetical protein
VLVLSKDMVNPWPRLRHRLSRRLSRWWRSINDRFRRWMDEDT